MRRLLLIAALACLLSPVSVAGGATLPPGFQEEVVFSGLANPMVVRFSPDGRVFVAEKSGLVKVFDSLSDPTPSTYADLRTKVHNYWDRGLLGMALDPQFPADPYIYVLYTHDAAIGGTAPRWGTAGATSDPCPNPPGGNVDGCVVSGRLSRVSSTGVETVLVTDWCQQYPSHSQGQIQFGPDGYLYASSGDGAAFGFTDWGQDGNPLNPCGDPPGGVGAVLTPPTAEGGSLRAQDLRTSGDPVSLDGSIIRVNPDNGAALPTNPLFSSPDLNARRIIAHGLRNPFRIAFRPGTSELWVGDVGLGRWEEINRITDVLGTVENGGWPCYEGPASPPSWQNAGIGICTNLYAAGPSAVHAPYFSYSHSGPIVAGETCAFGSSAISGLAFYQGGPYPASYDDALFFSDYSRNCVWAMRAGANGLPNPSDIVTFVAPGAGPVSLEIGPSGDLFYPGYDDGTIRRIRYFAANQPPIAVAQATPTNGIAPLFVSFDGRGSSDPEGGALTYAWDLDGDGQYDDSTSSTPSRTYTQNGQVTVRLRVTDTSGATDFASIVITVGNTAPVATITAPSATTTWAVGETIAFSGTGTDAQSGALPASAFQWELVLHHCPSTCHEHIVQAFPGIRNGTFDGPNHDYPAHLELRLTVTDSGGLKDTEVLPLEPKTVQTTFATSIPGLELTVDDDTGPAPFTRTSITGSTHVVSAPATQTLYGVEFTFQSWSDGGARVHQITTASPGTITAQYSGATPAACFYNPATRSVAASILSTSQATLKVTAGGQLLFGAVPLPCGGATATNTDTVVVTGTSGTAERLTIDQSEALFGPGVEVETTTPEIEVVANLGDASDRLVVIGTSGDDKLSAGVNGVAIDADNDVDVTFAPSPAPATVELVGGGGKNTLTARGGSGTAAVFTGSVVLRAGDLGDILTGSNLGDVIVGGAGNDDVNGYGGDDTIDGGAGDDKLNGADGNDDSLGGLGADSISSGAGDDTIRAADGIADPVLNGGAGIDTAYYDLSDPVPSAVETKILDTGPPPPPPGPDTTPPETTITSGPTSPTAQTTATFALVSSEAGSTFACALDLGAFLPCASPVTYSALALGEPPVPRARHGRGRQHRPDAGGLLLDDRGGAASAPAASARLGLLCLQRDAEVRDRHDLGRRSGDARGRRQPDPLRRCRLRRRDDREHGRDHGHGRNGVGRAPGRRPVGGRARPGRDCGDGGHGLGDRAGGQPRRRDRPARPRRHGRRRPALRRDQGRLVHGRRRPRRHLLAAAGLDRAFRRRGQRHARRGRRLRHRAAVPGPRDAARRRRRRRAQRRRLRRPARRRNGRRHARGRLRERRASRRGRQRLAPRAGRKRPARRRARIGLALGRERRRHARRGRRRGRHPDPRPDRRGHGVLRRRARPGAGLDRERRARPAAAHGPAPVAGRC